MTAIDDKALALGLIVQPGIGNAYPESNRILLDWYKSNVASLPWVPAGWYDQVAALAATDPTMQLRPLPTKPYGAYAKKAPDWLKKSTQFMDAWQLISDNVLKILTDYFKQVAAQEKPALDAALANAAFWNSPLMTAAINTQQALRAAPAAIGGAAGTLVSDAIGPFLKKAWWVLVLVVVALVFFSAYKAGGVEVAVDYARQRVRRASQRSKEAKKP